MERIDHMMRIRLPADLHAKLVAAAGRNNRSVNAEIVHRLGEDNSSTIVQEEWEKAQKKISDLEDTLSFYRRNIGLYSASAQMLGAMVETADDIIQHLPDLPHPKKLSFWRGMISASGNILRVVKSFRIPDPAEELSFAATSAEAKAAREANEKIKRMAADKEGKDPPFSF